MYILRIGMPNVIDQHKSIIIVQKKIFMKKLYILSWNKIFISPGFPSPIWTIYMIYFQTVNIDSL